MRALNKIEDKLKRNAHIYAEAVRRGRIMGMGFTWLLWKNHTKFLLRIRNPQDKAKEAERIVEFMDKAFGNFVGKYKSKSIYDYDIEADDSWHDARIWVFWNDPQNMPLMVRQCVRRIRAMANGHEVVLLTEANLHDYVDLDPLVWRKYAEGKITRTHISDFIRTAVLSKYGGLYLDSTIYPLRPIPEEAFKSSFFTGHAIHQTNDPQIAHSRWSSFMMGCRRGNLMMRAALDVFTEYWHRYDHLMDYVLVDYTYNLLYDHIPSIRMMIDALPERNANMWTLQPMLGEVCTEEMFESLLSDTTYDFYKFSYKDSIHLPMCDKKGSLTLLGRLCDKE